MATGVASRAGGTKRRQQVLSVCLVQRHPGGTGAGDADTEHSVQWAGGSREVSLTSQTSGPKCLFDLKTAE